MADNQAGPDVLAEAYRRGLLPPDKAQAFEEAARRGVIHADSKTLALIDARQNVRQNTQHMGVLGGMERAAGQSAAFGLVDEAAGKINHGIVSVANLLRQGGIGKGFPYSGDDMDQATVQATRENMRQFGADHPVANTAAAIGGAVVAPGMVRGATYIAKAPTLAARVLRSAGVGAAAGAASGAGSAEGGAKQRATGAAVGGLVGATAGAGLPVAIAGGSRLVRPLVRGAANLTVDAARQTGRLAGVPPQAAEAVPSLSDKQRALRRIAELARNSGVTAEQIAASNQPTTAQAMGRTAVNHAAALARREGTTPNRMGALMVEQAANEPRSIMDRFSDITGVHPSAAKGDIDHLVQIGRDNAAPLYDAALSQPGPVWTSKLEELSKKPSMRAAITGAMKDAANSPDHAMEDFLAPLPAGEGGGVVDEAGQAFRPTARGWDLIKKRLAGEVERDDFGRARPDTVAPGNYHVRRLDETLSGELRDAIPGYGEALDTASDYLKLSRAYENGQKLLANQKVDGPEFADRLAKLGSSEQEAFAGGAGRELYDRALKGRLNADALLTPGMRGKLGVLMGPKADEWTGHLIDLSKSAGTRRVLSPGAGSPTMPLLNAAAEQDANPIGTLLATVAQAPGKPITTAAKLMQMGADYGKTAATTPAIRNAMGDFYMQTPDKGAAELQQVMEQIRARQPRPISPGLASYLASQTQ
jgi:hypothetical protein